jgi:hypothetical protein
MTVLTTPRGKSIFPHLTEADTMFHPEGLFHVKLECDKAEGQPIILAISDIISQQVVEAGKKQPNNTSGFKRAPLPYEILNDNSENEKVVFNFKLKASGTRKSDGKTFTQKPLIVNALKQPLEEGTQIWGDSILKITFEPYGWNMPIGIGCTLRLKEVQVLELVTGKTKNTLSGFDVEPVVEPKIKQEINL